MSQALTSSASAPDRRGVRAGAVPLWAMACFVVGSLPLAGTGLFLSHLLILLLGAAAFVTLMRGGRPGPVLVAAAVAGSMVVGALVVGATGNPRFANELGKMLLLVLAVLAVHRFVRERDLLVLARTLPRLLCIAMFFVWLGGWGYYYGDDGRFGVPWLGSPNSTGFFIALNIVLVMYSLGRRRQIRFPDGATDLAVLLMLAGALVATQSLGGLSSGIGAAAVMLGMRARHVLLAILLLLLASIVVLLWVPGIEVPELIGSGRLIIWQQLVSDVFSGGPLTWLLGFGPGGIDLQPWFTLSVQSAHSMFVETLFAFGLIGLVALAWTLWRVAAVLRRHAHPDPLLHRSLSALFIALVVGFAVDTYLMTAQIVWVGGLVCGLLYRFAGPTR